MELGLQNKTVFISGSSQGIGLAIAKGFLSEKANVAISGRDAEKLKKVTLELERQYGPGRVTAIVGDMTVEENISKALERVVNVFDSLDVVVANLGSGSGKLGLELERGDWQSMIDVNFYGAMSLAKLSVPYLKNCDNGSITFISSIAGSEVLAAPISYGAAKAALQHAAKNLSHQLGGQGIRVNTISPGNILAPGGVWDRKLNEDPDAVDSLVKAKVPLGRLGNADEIADAVLFITSERARFVTGALWVIDGGQSHF